LPVHLRKIIVETKNNNSDRKQRIVSRIRAAEYCSLKPRTFDRWRKRNLLPGPIPGTRKFDLDAIDLFLDHHSGLNQGLQPNDPFDAWLKDNGYED
jgi:hypothetical protein